MEMPEPVRVMTIKPLEQHYYSTVLRTVMAFYQNEPISRRVIHKTYELQEQEFFIEYQDANIWFDLPEPPIFGKFDFLKDLK